jgi:hypothetical protein
MVAELQRKVAEATCVQPGAQSGWSFGRVFFFGHERRPFDIESRPTSIRNQAIYSAQPHLDDSTVCRRDGNRSAQGMRCVGVGQVSRALGRKWVANGRRRPDLQRSRWQLDEVQRLNQNSRPHRLNISLHRGSSSPGIRAHQPNICRMKAVKSAGSL